MHPPDTAVFSFDWWYPVAFIWGLLVIASFAGWGRTLVLVFIPNYKSLGLGWGSFSAWGMVIFLLLSGPLLMSSTFSTAFVVFFLLIGLLMQGWKIRSASALLSKESWEDPFTFWKKLFVVFLFLLIVWSYAGAVAAHWYNQYDDLAAYFYLVKKLLDTGTMYDPFSFRMMGALGGHLTLSTLILAFLPWKYAHLLDLGIARLIVLGQTLELIKGKDTRAWNVRLFLLVLALTFSIARNNSGSEDTGVAIFLLFFRMLEFIRTKEVGGWISSLLLGAIMAAAATLRCHNIIMIGFLGICFVFIQILERKDEYKHILLWGLRTSLAFLLFIIPWWVVSYRSGGTFLYPLFRGDQHPQFEVFSYHPTLLFRIQFIGGFFTQTEYILLFIPFCLLALERGHRDVLLYGFAILLFTIAFMSQFTAGQSLYFHACRYLEPIALAYALYSAGIVAKQFAGTNSNNQGRGMRLHHYLAIGLGSLMIVLQSVGFLRSLLVDVIRIEWAVNSRNEFLAYVHDIGPITANEARREYTEAFSRLPAHSKTLIALDFPFLVDNREHPTFSVDIPGAVSPPPGMPSFHGAAALQQYLVARGFDYIAYVPFDQSKLFYGRENANWFLKGIEPYSGVFARFEIDFLDSVDALTKINPVLYDSPTIRIIALKNTPSK